jgi:hypothetical protein
MGDLHHHEQADSIAFMLETLPKGLQHALQHAVFPKIISRKDVQFVEGIP